MAEIIDRIKSSSHPLAPGRIYSGLIKSVDSRGAVTVYIQELASSFDKVVPLNTNDNSVMAIGDVVKCTFTNEFFTELVVLGLSNIKEVAAASTFSPVLTSPTAGQTLQYNGTSWVNTGFTYKVGDTGPGGGIIFFVDRFNEYPGFTYLEVSPSSAQVTRTWATGANQSASVSGADSRALGEGYQNTIDIVAQAGNVDATCAAAYCADLVSGGQSDWYLPSISEMRKIYAVVHLDLGVGDFNSTGTYFSSSEFVNPQVWAFGFQFGTPSNQNKSSGFLVRPVRRF